MNNLDEQGKKIYNDYIHYRDVWISYIEPIAIKKLNDYLSNQNRVYNLNDYWNRYISNYSEHTINKSTKDITARYRKLSILFHPDKFTKPGSTTFFSLLNKYYKEGFGELLHMIDIISHLLLELPSLEKIVKNLETLTNNHDLHNQMEPIQILELLNSDNPNLPNTTNTSNEFLESVCYKFYTDDPNSITYVNKTCLNEIEIIEKIQNCNNYDKDFVLFCKERYSDNHTILEAIIQWFQKQNDIIKKKINSISNK
jgi:hypothetical protein